MSYVGGDGRPPHGPHLALGPDSAGQSIALPNGAALQLIHNPDRPDGIFNVGIVGLEFRGPSVKLVLKCACGRLGCTRELPLKGTWVGRHPSPDDAAQEKVARMMLGTK